MNRPPACPAEWRAMADAKRAQPADGERPVGETCDYCGSDALEWRKCKLICTSCRQINKSCADL